jgi:cysteine desulfurase
VRRHDAFDANAAGRVLPAAWAAYLEHGAGAGPGPHAQVAAALGTTADHVRFTSGGTEANAHALAALLAAPHLRGQPRHALISAVDHAAVVQTARRLADRDPSLRVEQVQADANGQILTAAVAARLQPQTCAVAVCMACNETGVVQPVAEIGALLRPHGIGLHVDAVQAVGRLPVHFTQLQQQGIGSLSLSGHKLGAVGGVGALLADPAIPNGLGLPDASAENPAGCAALAVALAQRVGGDLLAQQRQLASRRDRLEAAIGRQLTGVHVLGAAAPRLANTSCLLLSGCEGDGLMMALDLAGFLTSTGSACSAGSLEASPILLGMGLSPTAARQSLRLSLTESVKIAEIDALVDALVEAVRRARALGGGD